MENNVENSIDNEIRLQVRTKSDRPVMNASDTPEYVNLATHFNERQKKHIDTYESLQFTERSMSYVNSFEDEALLSGEVKPVVVRQGNATPYVPKTFMGDSYATNDSVSPDVNVSTEGPLVNQGTTSKRLPYQDIPGNFASVDTLTPKYTKEQTYISVPQSMAIFYNPLFLMVVSLFFALVIVAELIGLVYVY